MKISEFQQLMKRLYFASDSRRGIGKTFMWLIEEVGELAELLRQIDEKSSDLRVLRERLSEEFADVFAWLCSMANLTGIDLEKAALSKYPMKCPRCGSDPCICGK